MNGKLFLISVVLTVSLCVISTMSSARDDLSYGPVGIKLSLDASAVYDDNVFLDFDKERDDYYYEIVPQFEFSLPVGDGIFELTYRYQILSFQDSTGENEENHQLDFSGMIDVGERLNLQLSSSFWELSDAVIVDITNRVTRDVTKIDLQGAYEFSENYTLQLGYAGDDYDYELGLADHSKDEYQAELSYRIWPNLSILAGYVLGEIDLKDSRGDASFNRYHAGMRGQIIENLSTELRVGMEERDYDLSARDNMEKLHISGHASYKVSDTMLVQLEGERKIVEAASVEQNSYLYRTANLGLEKWLTEEVKADVRAEYHEADFERRIVPDGRGPREDKLWIYAADISYFFKEYLSVGLGYESQVNGSNFKEMDYEHNLIRATVRVEY